MTFPEWLGPFVLVGRSFDWLLNLIAFSGYIITFTILGREYLRYRQLVKMREIKPAKGAIALAIGVGMDISSDTRFYLGSHFGSDDQGQPIVPLLLEFHREGFFDREGLLKVIREVRNKIRELMLVGGVSEVHLFYGGPIAVAAAIGAIVDNWVPVKWYSHNKATGQYEYLFTLDVEMVKGID